MPVSGDRGECDLTYVTAQLDYRYGIHNCHKVAEGGRDWLSSWEMLELHLEKCVCVQQAVAWYVARLGGPEESIQ